MGTNVTSLAFFTFDFSDGTSSFMYQIGTYVYKHILCSLSKVIDAVRIGSADSSAWILLFTSGIQNL